MAFRKPLGQVASERSIRPSFNVATVLRLHRLRLAGISPRSLLVFVVVAVGSLAPITVRANPFVYAAKHRGLQRSATGTGTGLTFGTRAESPVVGTPKAAARPSTVPVHSAPTNDSAGADAASEPGALELNKPGLTQPELGKPKLLRKGGLPPFYLHREYATHTTRAVTFPPLYVHRTPSKGHADRFFHADLGLTFGWYDKERQKRKVFNPIGLFFYGKTEHKTVWTSLPLLMGYKRVGEQYNFGQFPLFWAWGNRHVKNFLAIPLHFQQKTPDSFSAVTSLLFWYGHRDLGDDDRLNDRKHFIAFPLYFRLQRGLKRHEISPVYFAGSNGEKGIRHATLLPLFHWQSREFDNRRELWTLGWVQRSDRARRKRSWALPPLITFGSDTPTRRLLSITPLFWHSQNHLKASDAWVVGPFGAYRDPRQHNRWLLPFWWQLHDLEQRARTEVIFPLVRVRRTPEFRRVDTLLGSWKKTTAGGLSLGLHPLLSYVRRDPKGVSGEVILGGLAWWRRTEPGAAGGAGRKAWGIGPLAYRRTSGTRSSVGLPPLLSFFGRDGQKSYQVVTPLFWRFRDRDPTKQRHTLVLPPLYFHKDNRGVHGGLPPLIFAGSGTRRAYTVIPALAFGHVVDHERKESLTLSPLFVRWRAPERSTLGVGLLGWDIQRPDARHSVLFPLYYRRQVGTRTTMLTPLGGTIRDGDRHSWLLGPVYGGRTAIRTRVGVAPLFLHERRSGGPTRGSTTFLFPLFARDRRPQRDLDIWTPLIWRASVRDEKPRTGFAAIPLYFRQRQPHGVNIDAGPGWFHSRDRLRRTHTTIAGPFFHRLSRTALHTGVFPIAWWKDSVEQRRLFSLPLIYHDEDKLAGKHTTIAVPFWFDRKQANGRRTWVAFPFMLGRSRRNDYTRVSMLPPGYVDVFRLGKNRRLTGVVPFAFRYQKCGFVEGDAEGCRYTLWGSLPLFLYGKDGHGRTTHGALALYYYDRDPEGFRFYTPLAGAHIRPGERLKWYAGPLYRDTTRSHTTTALFPLFYDRRHRAVDERLTLIVPPLYISRHKQDRSWWQAGLLLWQFRKQHQVTTVVAPPVFGHVHAYAERRMTWLLPLFLRDNRMGKAEKWTAIFPALYFQHEQPDRFTAVQFPALWHFRKGEKRTTIGAFVWYDVERHGKRTQVVPALYVRRKTPDVTTTVLGPGLAWWRVHHHDPQGETAHAGARAPATRHFDWNALLGLFGGGRDAEGRFMTLFHARIPLRSRGGTSVRQPSPRSLAPAPAPAPTTPAP
ncbi:MAG: hypothetical protein V3V08_02015 [Nannocystaceae bacterium]